jgi:hypothetical protein
VYRKVLDDAKQTAHTHYVIKRLFALSFIFVCTTIAWFILGGTVFNRTNSAQGRLTGRVQSIWGTEQTQKAVQASYEVEKIQEQVVERNGRKEIERVKVPVTFEAPVLSTRAEAKLDLDHRKKGLLWYSTYTVRFEGVYRIPNPDSEPRDLRLALPFPADQAVFDDLVMTVDGKPADFQIGNKEAFAVVRASAGQTVELRTRYRSQGLNAWRYSFGENVNQVRDFNLRVTTNFRDVDFPDNTLAPSKKTLTANGWQLDWTYTNLLSGYQIAVAMPEKLQPGPLAAEICFFAPVSLFFFFFLMFIITTLRNLDLHPMNYFFLAAAFFAFHLLLAYLVDHLDIHLSFVIAAVVSILLVVTYLRLVLGLRFAMREAALAQLIYLVLFSYAFFFKGFTGLAITIGSILTLFVVMQLTGRINWAERFSPAPPPPPQGPFATN